MIDQSVDKNHSDPLGKRNVGDPCPTAPASEWVVRAMAHRADNGDRKIARVAESGHDDGKPEVLWRRAANQGDDVSKGAADCGAEEDIEGYEPPEEEVFQSDGLAEVDEDEAREEEGKDELREELEGGPGHDLGSRVGEDQADDGEG